MANSMNKVKKKSGGAQMKKGKIGRNQGLNYSEEAVEKLKKKNKTKKVHLTRGLIRVLFVTFVMAFLIVWYTGNQYAAHTAGKKIIKGVSFLLLIAAWIMLYIFPKYYYAMIRLSNYEMTEEDEKNGKVQQVRKIVIICIICTVIFGIFDIIIS